MARLLVVDDESGMQDTTNVTINVSSSLVRRTVIYIQKETVNNQDMFIRGGIDWVFSKNTLSFDFGKVLLKWYLNGTCYHVKLASTILELWYLLDKIWTLRPTIK